MKSILLSKQPKMVANVLNGLSKILICKKFPKDFVGWVYIYCTKGELLQRHWQKVDGIGKFITYGRKAKDKDYDSPHTLNGKVVARFWCDKVEEIKYHFGYYDMNDWTECYILEKSCLTNKQLDDYLKASAEYDENKSSKIYGYGIYISKLKVFDRPKELSEFYYYCKDEKCEYRKNHCSICYRKPLTKAQQNYCYIERS